MRSPFRPRTPEANGPLYEYEFGPNLSEYLETGAAKIDVEGQQHIINNEQERVFAVVGGADEQPYEKPAAPIIGTTIENYLFNSFDEKRPEDTVREAFTAAQTEMQARVAANEISAGSRATATVVKFFLDGTTLKAAYGNAGEAGIVKRSGNGHATPLELLTPIDTNYFSGDGSNFNPTQFGVISLQPEDRLAILSKGVMGVEPQELLKQDELNIAMSTPESEESAMAFVRFGKRASDKAAVVIDVVKKRVANTAYNGAATATTMLGSRRMSRAEANHSKRNRALAIGALALGAAGLALIAYAATRGHDVKHPSSLIPPDKPETTPQATTPLTPTPAAPAPRNPSTWHPHNFYVEPGSGIEQEIHEEGHRLVGYNNFTGADAHRIAEAAHRRFGNHLITLVNHSGPDYYKVGNDVRISAPGPAHYSSHLLELFMRHEILKSAK
ncbi:MAG: hypothetical protein JWL89_162 [Candidatus Saccharibacteria bacterium]|nr:hypothetical protein [Candidatus Saccharibacteria bacterium]